MNLRPMTPEEHKYAYNQSQQLTGQTGCIGRLHGKLIAGTMPTSWEGRWRGRNTEEFQADREILLQALRYKGCILENRSRLTAYCLEHLDSVMDGDNQEYGFRADTDQYTYLLRLNPREGEACLYCYIRKWLDRHVNQARRGIRFVTPGSENLFSLRDGDRVQIVTPDGRVMHRTCRYIDEMHFEIGAYPRGELYHICQFAELMERAGNKVSPLGGAA